MARTKPQLWRMFAGKDHCQWRKWVRIGVMAIGWGQDLCIEPFEGCAYQDIEDIFVKEHGDTRRTRRAARQFWRFAAEARKGDLVCVYDMGSLLGAGIIIGDYQYVDDSLSENGSVFACRRDVDWLRTDVRPLSPHEKSVLLQRNEWSIVRIDDERVKAMVHRWAYSEIDENIENLARRSGPELDDDEFEKKMGRVTRTAVRRDSKKANTFGRAYNMECQICRMSIIQPDGRRFVEVHHIKPVGERHNGPDRMSNMICLCPNHHAEMALGAFYIDPESRSVVHFDRDSPIHGKRVHSLREGWPDAQFLKYHKMVICAEWAN